jgi:hypothetical protein
MSDFVLTEEASAGLPNPPATKQKFFVDIADGRFKKKLPSGVIVDFESSASYNDESAQDAVGNILTDSADIDFTYNDAAPSISAVLVAVGTAGTYGDATTVPVITLDSKGRVTGVTPTAITPSTIGAQPVDSDLTAIAALSSSGLVVKTGAGSAASRSIDAGAGISVTDGDGVAGNPTVANTDRGSVAVTAHEGESDPHPQYLQPSEVLASLITALANFSEAYGFPTTSDSLEVALSKLAFTNSIEKTIVSVSASIPDGHVWTRSGMRLTGTAAIRLQGTSVLRFK